MSIGKSTTTDYGGLLREQLREPALAAEYLAASIDPDHPELFLLALRNVADASGGLGAMSKATELNRQSLYRMLSDDGNPRLSSLVGILKALGLELAIRPQDPAA